MSNPINEDGRTIAWNSNLGRFYDVDTNRIVSTLVGLTHLHVEFTAKGQVITDDLNGPVPSLDKLPFGSFAQQFAQVTRESNLATYDVYAKRAPEGSYYTTVAVFLNPDGSTNFLRIHFSGGVPLDRDLETRKMLAYIISEAEAEGIDLTSEQAGLAILQLEHYVTR